MRGRLGVLIGFAAGYVLGTKAGQERYEEIRDTFNRLMGTEPAQQLQAEVRQAADKAASLAQDKASETIAKASDKVDEVVNGNGSSDTATETTGVAGPQGTLP
ncbi:MAG TPA: YtxH domain-containing protein [Egibacteraceae bacterium]|nr:YtxH domain-containing protein [Egibacteraceae bacterium]